MKNRFYSDFNQQKIIFIIRNSSFDNIIKAAITVFEAGGKFVEITLNSGSALEAINYLVTHKPTDCYIGAGTVRTPLEVIKVKEAGVSFIVTPVCTRELIDSIKKLHIPSFIGSYTPTEIFRASSYGASFIKVFPAKSPSYIKDLKGPLDDIPLVAVGGVNLENAASFFEAGATAICLGGSFFQFDKSGAFDKKKITEKVRKILKITDEL